MYENTTTKGKRYYLSILKKEKHHIDNMKQSEKVIKFVSLGPGDPELITIKGLKALQEASFIYCPATMTPSGTKSSHSSVTLQALGIDSDKIKTFTLPMSKNRDAAIKVYQDLADDIEKCYKNDMQIAVAAEGDAGFYASIQYLYELLKEKGLQVTRIAGVPAFIAAGPVAGIHLVKQEERLLVVPGIISEEELTDKINSGYVVVIMKLPLCEEAVHKAITQNPEAEFHYFENISRENEFYTSDTDIIKDKKFPYFSLMIISKKQ